jgi:hypothetical protein
VDAAGVVNRLLRTRGSFVALTTSLTGSGILAGIDASAAHTFCSFRHDLPGTASASTASPGAWATTGDVAAALDATGIRADVVLVDPFHTYEASVDALTTALAVATDDGYVVVHDCLPPRGLVAPEFRDAEWCGLTFLAFRDVVEPLDREWFVLDCDLGVGVIGPAGRSSGRASSGWSLLSTPERLDRWARDPGGVMRAVAPYDLDEALARLEAGQDVVSLAARHAGTGRLGPRRLSGQTRLLADRLAGAARRRGERVRRDVRIRRQGRRNPSE